MEVEKLFQQQSIAAVREVETKTRHEIEEKKKQLRQVVGDSYRDLISSADTIIDISRSCHRLVELTGSLQHELKELARGSLGHVTHVAAATHAASSYDQLYALGSRIKYLVDTPETIYGCLDGGEFLAAACRYVRAAEVHRILAGGQAKQMAQRFPLLQHQWPLVKKLRSQVYAAADTWLGSHGQLTALQAASTLVAQALLKPMDGAEVLKTFLTARQAYIMQCLSEATGAGTDTDLDSLACILADVATLVCTTLSQCGELFLQLPGVTSAPLLADALLQGGHDTSSDLLFDTGKEADAWKSHVDAVKGRLIELSAAGLALECSGWLDQLSHQLRQLGGGLLGPCSSGEGLLQVEAAVKEALGRWHLDMQAGRSHAAEATTAGEDNIVEPSVTKLSWGDVCQWVLGRPCPLWPLLFEHPLLDRAKQLVSQDFLAVADTVQGLLYTAVQEAANLPPSAPGTYQAGRWFEYMELQPCTPLAGGDSCKVRIKHRRSVLQPKPGSAAAGRQSGMAIQNWLARAEHVVQQFDQQVNSALDAALDACGSNLSQQSVALAAPNSQHASSPGDIATSRVLVLEPFVQERCMEAIEGIAASLDAQLLALPTADLAACRDAETAAAYAPIATKALLIGRVALGLGSRSRMLPVVLGRLDQWIATVSSNRGGMDAAASYGLLTPRSSAVGAGTVAAPSARYEQMQQRLHLVGMQGYAKWADWASAGLGTTLIAALTTDCTLGANQPLRAWDECVIGTADKDELAMQPGAGGSLEMRFQLPSAPSPAAVQLAVAACQEVDRAGGHLLEEEPLQLFQWKLCGSLISLLGTALADQDDSNGTNGLDKADSIATQSSGLTFAGKLSEKGVLQLLFDVRFVLDLLSGGSPVGAGTVGAAESTAAVAAQRREAAQLEAQLSSRLDPIDWATYEPYLYANKDRAATRRQVLFGTLLCSNQHRTQKGGAGAAHASSNVSAESNILLMATVGPRFSYLPVTTPVGLMRQASVHQLPKASSSSAAELAWLSLGAVGSVDTSRTGSAGSDKSAAAFSFATLLSSKPRPAGEDGEGARTSINTAAMGTGVSAAANKLVGLLGDKAAEVTSAFSLDMSTTGLLSSFARGFK